MTVDRIAAISDLLAQTEEAHGVYESTELHGVYDKKWPSWYAAYAIEHGFGELAGGAVTTEALAQLLASSFDEFQRIDPKPAASWAAWTAGRIVGSQ